jgi:hypothetical protein
MRISLFTVELIVEFIAKVLFGFTAELQGKIKQEKVRDNKKPA